MPFSHRTAWGSEPNALTKLLLEKQRLRTRILDLTDSNPTQCGFQPPPSLRELLAGPEDLSYDPDPKGLLTAREAIASYYGSKGIDLDPGSLLLTSSTSEAYSHLFRLLCNAGDSVLVPRPSYPLFGFLAALSDIHLHYYDLLYDGEWHIDVESVRDKVQPRTKAFIVIHPNNPTGSYLKQSERQQLEDLLSEKSIPLVADEVFHPYSIHPSPQQAGSLAGSRSSLTFTLNGLSKLAGLPQMKLSWATVSGPQSTCEEAMKRLEIIADTFLSVGTPIQRALPSILDNAPAFTDPLRNRVSENYSRLQSLAQSAEGVSVFHCEGGWSAMIRVPETRSDEQWCLDLLDRHNVLVHPGHFFDCTFGACLVVSLLPQPQTFEQGINTIVNFVRSEREA